MSRNIRQNIKPYTLRGSKDFAAAFGISDVLKQAELRSMGMPCYNDKGTYFYDPVEVLAWMKNRYKIQEVKI